jgi:hypothetical protein
MPTGKMLYLIIAPELRYTFDEVIYGKNLRYLSEDVFASIHGSKYPRK